MTESMKEIEGRCEAGLLKVLESNSSSYPPRTYHNAKTGHLTLAIAINFDSAGEKLTKKAAGDRYLSIDINEDPLIAARSLYVKMKDAPGRVLNVAGNGIYTFKEFGWSQGKVCAYVHAVIEQVHKHLPFEKIVSGGQTGVDLAGGVAGVALNIPTEMMLPKGFIQRHEDNKDKTHTREQIVAQVVREVATIYSNNEPLIQQSRLKRPSP